MVTQKKTIVREEWGGDSEERGLQELLYRTQGQNQGGGWRWEGGGFSWGGVEGWGEKAYTTVIE